jgi:hypothetical protein
LLGDAFLRAQGDHARLRMACVWDGMEIAIYIADLPETWKYDVC